MGTEPPKGGSVPTKAFDEFWLAYPRKVGKADARRKFDLAVGTLRRRGEPEPLAYILGSLEKIKRSAKWRDEPEFIPHPSTWLHQGRFDDEPGIEVVNGLKYDPSFDRDAELVKIKARWAEEAKA